MCNALFCLLCCFKAKMSQFGINKPPIFSYALLSDLSKRINLHYNYWKTPKILTSNKAPHVYSATCELEMSHFKIIVVVMV